MNCITAVRKKNGFEYQKNIILKTADVFLRPSFHGQIFDCTAILHFVHHALYNLQICPCQSRRAEMHLLVLLQLQS